jgi:hypothetical protein
MYQPLWQAFAALQAEAINRTSSAAIAPVGVTPTGKARRRNPPTVPINSSWRRDERHVVVPVSIRVATGEVTFMTTELGAADPLRADAAAGVTAHFSTPEAASNSRRIRRWQPPISSAPSQTSSNPATTAKNWSGPRSHPFLRSPCPRSLSLTELSPCPCH